MPASSALIRIAEAILSQPTAPFCEEAVRLEIGARLAGLAHVTCQTDSFGNLIACYRRGAAAPLLAFAAHMDHPGFVRREGAAFEFLGGVPAAYRDQHPPTRDYGRFAMWDLPAFELRDGRIYSRACDDLIGCAAIVSMFEKLELSEAEVCVYGLFTRAEEVGFVGAIQLARSGLLPAQTTVISLETSSENGGACRMGDGVIVRVGDRTSIFDPLVTAVLVQCAREAKIPYQRCLMSGGTCEATAYQLYGYRTAGLCVALGNYHNCGPQLRIESEFVALADVEALVELCFAAALTHPLPDPLAALRTRLETEMENYRAFFPPARS